jgi:hypothetical protein
VRHAQGGFDERVQTTCLQRGVQLAQQSAHQAKVRRADDLAVLLGGFAERAVMQQDLPFAAGGHCLGRKPMSSRVSTSCWVAVMASARWNGAGRSIR